MTKEEIRKIIASTGEMTIYKKLGCEECPYIVECHKLALSTCSGTLKKCNEEYIKELGKTNMRLADDMIKTLNKGENKMTTMLPDNTIRINPQGEIEGLDSLSLDSLHKLLNAARDLYDRKTDEHEQQLWDNVVKAVKEYCEDYGNIVILCDGGDSLEFNCHQMGCRGEIDCE